jgi:predicted metalloprotease with PDZ domain
MKRLSIAAALLLSLTLSARTAHAQQPDDKKIERQPDLKKAPDNKGPTPEKKELSIDELKKKLSVREEEIAKIRQEMLKEVEAEEKKVADALKSEQDAMRAGNRDAIPRFNELQRQKNQLQNLRFTIQNGQPIIRKPLVPVPAPNLPDDARLGIAVSPVTSLLTDQLGLPKNEGMVLMRVDANSPAGKAGLKTHDILIKIDGKSVPSDRTEFLKVLAEMKNDVPVEALILRGGMRQTITGLTIARPQPRQ